MKRTNFISVNKTLSIFSEQQLLKDQLFIFNGQLYEQTDGIVMGSPLGPLLASVFMCVALKKDWSRKARCQHTTGDLLMTH